MKKKSHKIILGVIITLIILILVGTICYFFRRKDEGSAETLKEQEQYVNRYEWTQMLCDKIGIQESSNMVPYFEDITKENQYFTYIQSAADWGILQLDERFDGDTEITGEYAALTVMKAVGDFKIRLYSNIQGEISEEEYIQLAVAEKLISEDELNQELTRKQCEKLLNNLEELYFGTFLLDDYCQVVYKEGVAEVPMSFSHLHNQDYSKVQLSGEEHHSYAPGTILILEDENTGLKMIKRVMEEEEPAGIGRYVLEDAKVEDAIESLVISDLERMTMADIVQYYGLNPVQTFSDSSRAMASPVSTKVEYKGFSINLTNEKEGNRAYLKVKLTDNDSGVSYELPVDIPLEESELFDVEVGVEDIIISSQINYTVFGGVEYADISTQAKTTIKGSVSNLPEKEKKIKLFQTPKPLGNGFIGADIGLYLVISASGEISLQTELPLQASVQYEKGRGLKNLKYSVDGKLPQFQANCEVSCKGRLEPTLVLLMCLDVLDVQVDGGVTATASVTDYPLEQTCTDVSVAFPIVTISVCNNDDKETIVGLLGWSGEWELITTENASLKQGIHYENYFNGEAKFVEECTYGKTDVKQPEEETEGEQEGVTKEDEEQIIPEVEKEIVLSQTWFSKQALVNVSNGAYYSMAFPDDWRIINEIVPIASYKNQLNEGPIIEGVTLVNERGIEIQYVHLYGGAPNYQRYYNGDSYYKIKITNLVESKMKLSPYDGDWSSGYYPKFVVAKIEVMELINEDETETNVQVGDIYYAIIPTDYLEDTEARNCGVYDGLTMMYFSSMYRNKEEVRSRLLGTSVFAKVPCESKITTQEEREIVAILESFQEGIYEQDEELYSELRWQYYQEMEEYMESLRR